jgi:hypothetical protein
MAERVADAASERARHDDSRIGWEELRNRLRAFGRFLYAEQFVGAPDDGSLDAQLDQIREIDPYDRVWITEGLGYSHGCRIDVDTGPMLRGRTLPAGSLVPLHAGMGLALATALLNNGAEGRIDERVRRFVDSCAYHAMRGYASVTFEALGLATRGLTPHVMSEYALEIERLHPGLVAYFWHGVGRGSYFSPLLAATLAPTRDLFASAVAAAPPGEAAANVIAGLSWAVVLVNIRDPDVIERFIASCADNAAALSAISDGVDRAMHVWTMCVGPDVRLRALADWRPSTAEDRWYRLVAAPASRRISGRAPVERPARWFRYRTCGVPTPTSWATV